MSFSTVKAFMSTILKFEIDKAELKIEVID